MRVVAPSRLYWKCTATALALLSASAVIAAPSWAQSSNGAQQMLERADANEDGAITREELVQSRANAFARLDRNEDGVVNKKDRPPPMFRKRFNEAVEQLLQQFDADGDGNLTRAEFVDGPTTGFDAADANGDDILSADELAGLPEPTA